LHASCRRPSGFIAPRSRLDTARLQNLPSLTSCDVVHLADLTLLASDPFFRIERAPAFVVVDVECFHLSTSRLTPLSKLAVRFAIPGHAHLWPDDFRFHDEPGHWISHGLARTFLYLRSEILPLARRMTRSRPLAVYCPQCYCARTRLHRVQQRAGIYYALLCYY
jgi:hypothetical protein